MQQRHKNERLISTLNYSRAKISFKRSQNKVALKFKQAGLRFEERTEQNDYNKYKQNSQERLDSGILTLQDIRLIKRKNLKSYEIAKYSDGYYTSLPEIEIFKIFEKKQISQDFEQILYNSLTNKTRSIDYFYSLYYHPGNILKMIKLYRGDEEFKRATTSFERFINLSMFKLKLK